MVRDTTPCAAAAHRREEELTQAILALAAKYGCYGYRRWFTTILMVFSRITSLGLDACVPINSVRGSCPMPILADTILTIRCPYCMEGTDLRPMIAYRDGRFVCHDCAHTVRPGEPEYRCTCHPCLRLSRGKEKITSVGQSLARC
jgi:hypothetical protein